jgi:serine/threonine protein kinase/tetratricopeptide (TPR) repeat protein
MRRMPDQRAGRLAELVKSAIEREPGSRAAFLDEECRSDLAMRAEIESLLQQQEGASRFIEMPALHLAAESLIREGSFRTGQTIGDYEIVSLIGSGGMGEVYLAQDRQLHRRVALKLVRRALASDDMLRHFKREEHLLASLNHPNIAQLYGSGLTADGVPFFVMEYVEGQRLDDYCNNRKLETKERLQLFRKVCSAVSYAHQRLVIHRDLKPANVRVTAEGEPKLLDFGIAKLIDVDNAQSSGQTLTLQGVMTPEYASPEQVRGETMTTASDVYSLGVVLYELLTGQRPYRLTSRRPEELSRAITDQTPGRPSSTSTLRQPQFLRGDLDNIVLKAMRKEPARRYQSVAEFSEDIRRHLDGLPVIARKDTLAYRSAKFVKRNRIGVAAVALILLSMLGGITATTWQAQTARREKAKAESVSAFLEKTLGYSNPLVNLAGKPQGETTVTDVLDEAGKQLESAEFAAQPEVRADLERTIAMSYFGQGRRDLWEKHLKKYVDIQRSIGTKNDAKTLLATATLAKIVENEDMKEAETLLREVLPQMKSEYRKGRITAADLADILVNFGYLRRTQGDSKEAETLFREALALAPKLPSDEPFVLGLTRSTLASTLADQGKFAEALQAARETVATYLQSGRTETADFAFALTILGGLLTEQGDLGGADTNLAQGEAILRKRQGAAALWLGDNLRNQAISFYRQARYTLAADKAAEAKRIYLETYGSSYDNYPTVLIVEGLILNETGRSAEGEIVLREALRIRLESLPKGHFWIALAQGALGECLATQRRFSEADPLLVDSYHSLAQKLGSRDPRTRAALKRLIAFYDSCARPEEAARLRLML